MEELYIENFAKPRLVSQQITAVSANKIEVVSQNLSLKNDDILVDMFALLDRLEKEIEKLYPDYADYRFILNKIREKLKNKNLEGIISFLDNLEQLLDIGLPAIILKKDLK